MDSSEREGTYNPIDASPASIRSLLESLPSQPLLEPTAYFLCYQSINHYEGPRNPSPRPRPPRQCRLVDKRWQEERYILVLDGTLPYLAYQKPPIP